MRLILVALVFCLVMAPLIAGDVIILKTGVRFEGKITSETDTAVTIVLTYGKMTFDRSQIKEIKRENVGAARDRELARAQLSGDLETTTRLTLERLASDVRGDTVSKLVPLAAELAGSGRLELLDDLIDGATRHGVDVELVASMARFRARAADDQAADLALALAYLSPSDPRFDPREAMTLLAPHLEAEGRVAHDIRESYARAAAFDASAYFQTNLSRALQQLEDALLLVPEPAEAVLALYVRAHTQAAFDLWRGSRMENAEHHIACIRQADPASREACFFDAFLDERDDVGASLRTYARLLGEAPPAVVDPSTVVQLRRRVIESLGAPLDITSLLANEAQWLPQPGASLIETREGTLVVRAPSTMVADFVLATVREELPRVAACLGLRPIEAQINDLQVIVHPDRGAFTTLHQRATHAEGLTIRLRSGDGRERVEIHTYLGAPCIRRVVLPHELAHALVSTKLSGTAGKLPLWLEEGLATLAEPTFVLEGRRAVFDDIADQSAAFAAALAATEYPSGVGAGARFYAVAHVMVAALLPDQEGAGDLWKLVDAYARGAEDAFANVYFVEANPGFFVTRSRWLFPR